MTKPGRLYMNDPRSFGICLKSHDLAHAGLLLCSHQVVADVAYTLEGLKMQAVEPGPYRTPDNFWHRATIMTSGIPTR